MSTLSKILVVLLVLLAIAHSAVSLAYLSQQQDWKAAAQAENARWQSTQGRLASETIKNKQIQEQLQKAKQDLQGELTLAETDLAEAQADIVALRLEIGTLTAGKEFLQQQLAKLTASLGLAQEAQKRDSSQLYDARNTAHRLQAENAQLEGQLSELTKDVTIFRAEVRRQKELIFSLQSDIRKAQGVTSAQTMPTVTAIRSATVVTAKPIRGKVTDVDLAENIAQINVGEIAGVTEGTRFIIYDNSEYVGDLKVTRVLRDQSLGTIVLSKQTVKVGDEVATELR